MATTHENEPLIQKTMQHVRALHTHGCETIGVDPVVGRQLVQYMDESLDVYTMGYYTQDRFSSTPRRVERVNTELALKGLDATVGHSAAIEREFVSGGKERLYLFHALASVSLADAALRGALGMPHTAYWANLDRYEHIPADDPRLSEQGDPYYKVEYDALQEEYEQAYGRILALTPDHFYLREILPPTPSQDEQLFETSRTNLTDLFAAHGVDVQKSLTARTLSFKYGNPEAFSNVTLRLRPAMTTATNRLSIQSDPIVSLSFEYQGASMYAEVPLGEATLMKKRLSLSGYKVQFESYAELAYLVETIEDLARSADHGILDYCDHDHSIYQLEYSLQPVVVEDSAKAERLIDFMQKRSS